MKKTMTFFLFWMIFLTSFSQTTIYISGNITDEETSNPITNHAVIIQSDSLNGQNYFPYYKVVYTNNDGLYADTVILPVAVSEWVFMLMTYDCDDEIHSFMMTYDGTTTVFQHDFSICGSETSDCHADFSAEHEGQSSLTYHFEDESEGDIVSWYWNFGDGTTSTEHSPVHTFAQAGMYIVCLNVQGADSSCFDSKFDSLFVGNGTDCHADFEYDHDSTSLTYHFEDESEGNIVFWYWNFGDGTTSTEHSPIHTYSQAGIYLVCLNVQGADSSCFDSKCDTLFVGNGTGCQAQFTYYPDTSGNSNIFQFIDLSTGNPTEWEWEFGDGTESHLQNPVHAFNAPGTYYVCLKIEGEECESTWCAYVTVGDSSNCVSYFTYSNAGLSVNYQGYMLNGHPATFSWSFGDGQTGQGQSIIHQYAAPGIYYVILTTNEDSINCQYISAQSVMVGDSAQYHQVYGQVFAGNFPLQSGIVMIFSLDSNYNYSPYIAACIVDSMGLYYFSMVPNGNYFVYALPFLPPGYLPTYYGDVLNWQDATIISLGQPSNPYDIHLIPAGSMDNGNGMINGQINMGGLKSSILDKVTMLLMNAQGDPIAYYKVSTEGTFTFPLLQYGTYLLRAEIPGVTSDVVQVVISSENPVVNVNMTFVGNKILGVGNPSEVIVAGILSPNPANENTTISIKSEKSVTISVELFNLMGQHVIQFSQELNAGINVLRIPVGQLPEGLYTLQIRSNDGFKITRKLIKS